MASIFCASVASLRITPINVFAWGSDFFFALVIVLPLKHKSYTVTLDDVTLAINLRLDITTDYLTQQERYC
jgi:hypothetical protein